MRDGTSVEHRLLYETEVRDITFKNELNYGWSHTAIEKWNVFTSIPFIAVSRQNCTINWVTATISRGAQSAQKRTQLHFEKYRDETVPC